MSRRLPSHRLVLLLAASSAIAAACAGEPTGAAEEPLAAICARLDAAIARIDTRASTPDDWWEAVARVVPGGFGGFTITSPGGNTIYLVEPGRFEAARSVAARATTCPNPVRLGVLDYVASAVAVRQGRWDYIRLRAWYEQLQIAASGLWTTADIAEHENRLRFGVPDETSRARVQEVAARLGIPVGAVEVVVRRDGFAVQRAGR